MRLPLALWRLLLLVPACAAFEASADNHVAVSAIADPDYTEGKYHRDTIKPESYVVMRGHYFSGATVDPSIDSMPFRRILAFLAPKLAKQQYWPAKSTATADLMLVVHWGVTRPRTPVLDTTTHELPTTAASHNSGDQQALQLQADPGIPQFESDGLSPSQIALSDADTVQQMGMGQLDQMTESIGNAKSISDIAQQLGYSDILRKYQGRVSTSERERTLRFDLTNERYFLIVRAYRLPAPPKSQRHRPVWSLYLNVSSPGNNFRTAMDHMSNASVDYFGRTTDDVETVTPKVLTAKIELGEPIILGEDTATKAAETQR